MRGTIYRDFSVLLRAKRNGQDGLWIPDIHITSQLGDQSPHQLVHSASFKTQDEAEAHGLKMGREWVERYYHIH